jgi:hypothetical protein
MISQRIYNNKSKLDRDFVTIYSKSLPSCTDTHHKLKRHWIAFYAHSDFRNLNYDEIYFPLTDSRRRGPAPFKMRRSEDRILEFPNLDLLYLGRYSYF